MSTCLAVGGQIYREQVRVHCSGHLEFIFTELHTVRATFISVPFSRSPTDMCLWDKGWELTDEGIVLALI